MHDLRVLREQLDQLRDGMRRRGVFEVLEPAIDRGHALDGERRTLIAAATSAKRAATRTPRKSQS